MSRTASRPIRPVSRPIEAVVRPPGSKSLTNRALVVAALVREGSVSRILGPLDADDTVVMASGLRRLGVMIDEVDDPWLVLGTGGHLTGDTIIDAGASGTTARFLTAVAALADGPVTIDGTDRMRQRPIADLTVALEQLGANVRTASGGLPVTITGPVHGGRTEVDGSVSSQFLSALLLVAPVLDEPVEIAVRGSLVSAPYVAGTLDVMRAFGADVSVEGTSYRVAATGYQKAHFSIEPDASAAVYPAVGTAIAGGRVVMAGIPAASSQPDLAVIELLEQMGCRVERQSEAIVVESDGGRLRAIDADLAGSPDGALALAVACLFADAPSRLRGLGTLRAKETDRLEALRTELSKLGAEVAIDGDSLVIAPGPLRPAEIETYDDHRMAMSFALAGLVIPGVVIGDPECVTKTWPGYFEALEAMCQT
ncbi:MAG TPA: 3-phosphoshikimate 1-carboxyvinyltransferase [Acidimicrobiia bacterium]|nr:3-phosphoshikimate 1-carboxyvinyltransferase [Acidimicrobiia bacterium]